MTKGRFVRLVEIADNKATKLILNESDEPFLCYVNII